MRPVQTLGPHTAPLGMTFYRSEQGGMFPPEYNRTAFIALHGSWNRARFIGYKVVMVRLHANNGSVHTFEDFMTGFLQNEDKANNYFWGGCCGVLCSYSVVSRRLTCGWPC
jgi:glucose/arabinose dehydrogenase